MPTLSANTATSLIPLSDEMERLRVEKVSAVTLQERRHIDWDQNYELYRNKVKTNRLTQRQAVNIPLMKETIKTLLSRIDDPPEVEWKELGGDQQKELYYQEIWTTFSKDNNLELIDILDKKNVLLYGLSVKKLNIGENGITAEVLDIYDIVRDPLSVAWDLESNRYIIHQNIFRSIKEILADERYTQKGKRELRIWADSVPGIVQSGLTRQEWERKQERLRDLRDRRGLSTSSVSGTGRTVKLDGDHSTLFAGGDTIVNITEHYTKRWNEEKNKFEKRVVTYAENEVELLDELLEDLIGVDFWPFVIWTEDPETNDIYPDAVADLVRPTNKVLNVWYSQLVENRTLKNFQMHWFKAGGDYTPQTYTPGPGVMLPAPPGEGSIRDVIMPVEVSGLDDTLEAINILTTIVERGTGATAIEKGQGEAGQQTLGEIEILVGKAGERVVNMAKFYRLAWYEFAWKWDALMHANSPKTMKLFKLGRSGKGYVKKILQSDWKSTEGYEPIVSSSSEQEQNNIKTIQKFQFVIGQFPDNIALRKIAQKKELEILDLSPDELKEVLEAEEEAERLAQQALQQQGLQGNAGNQAVAQPAKPAQPVPIQEDNSQVVNEIQKSLSQLQSI